MGDQSSAHPVRVLLVDDDPRLLRGLQRALASHGFEAFTATGADEAIETFLSRPVDVVVTDIVMPERDGIELIKDLRRCSPRIPIIAITGVSLYHGRNTLEVAAAHGADAFLAKPFDLEEFVAAIQRVLGEAG